MPDQPVAPSQPTAGAYSHGFARVAAVTIPVAIADPASNARSVINAARELHAESVAVAVFPELCLTGYAIDDLVLQDVLLDAVTDAIETLLAASVDLLPVLVVGAPLAHGNRLYNCAVVIHRGEILGVIPKSNLPTYREFYERRWYAPGDDIRGESIRIGDNRALFGTDVLFAAADVPGLVLHAEICEDMSWQISRVPRSLSVVLMIAACWPQAPPCAARRPISMLPLVRENRPMMCRGTG